MKRQRVREVIKTHFRKIKIETGAIELSKIKKSLLCMPCRGCRLSVVSSRIQVANIAAFFIKGGDWNPEVVLMDSDIFSYDNGNEVIRKILVCFVMKCSRIIFINFFFCN
jgi:hypothetical protein